ncbi:MAG: helix-turn-helix domain-containing protein [Lachnospiraceae bacterium]|nr:helix-turn-helix domain-containing protein [Lachnospiraceae bacterium]
MKKVIYTPLTATPFQQTKEYRESLPQNPTLAKYIRCFWGSGSPYLKGNAASATIVIPDTCVDVIYHIDHTENTISGRFCGINDASFVAYTDTQPGHLISVFAIRFYAWAAYAFSEDSLKGTRNACCDVPSRFQWLDQILRRNLLEKHTLKERTHLTEELLLSHSSQARQHHAVNAAVGEILLQRGALTAADLARECFISGRHLERLFHEYIGITPKKLCSLVRYQYLWNDILRNPQFNILDAVCKYGYADQPHLLREFKRYHTMNIQKAKTYAQIHVGNIQSFS